MALVLRLDMTFPISPQISHEKSSKTTAYALPFCETPPADTTWLYPFLTWHIIPDQAQILNAPCCKIKCGVLQVIWQYYAVINGFFKEICCQV
jgi:hypothetical protein